jgi:dTDP-4-dehydrorhamnose 3,5-epimerase
MIEGVVVQELKKIVDEQGKVLHMLRADSPLFTKFGEIYFSIVNPDTAKPWKKHFKMTQHLAVPVGRIRLVIYDDRQSSKSTGKLDVLDIGEDNYCLVKIPPLVWYGFKAMSSAPALIADCADIPHDPDEIVRLEPSTDKIPFNWT